MANAQALNAIAGLLKGFQAGYGGAKEQAGSEEERAMRNRFQQAQINNMDQDNALKKVQLEQQAPLVQAQTQATLGKGTEVAPDLADMLRKRLGMPGLNAPMTGTSGQIGASLLNNENTNATRADLSRVKANRPDEVAKYWVQQNKQLTDVVANWDAKLLGIQSKLSIMTDPDDRKQLLSDLEDAKAQKKVWQDQLDKHKFEGIQQGLNPALVGTTDDSAYRAYKAKQEADKFAASQVGNIQNTGSVMPVSSTAQPSMGAPSLKDMLLKKFGM